MVALALLGIAATSMTEFDLAALPVTPGNGLVSSALLDRTQSRSHYLLPKLEEEDSETSDGGIRVKLRWKKVKLSVPFGPG